MHPRLLRLLAAAALGGLFVIGAGPAAAQAPKDEPREEISPKLAKLMQQALDPKVHPDKRRAALLACAEFKGSKAVYRLTTDLLLGGEERDPFMRQAAAEVMVAVSVGAEKRVETRVAIESAIEVERHLGTKKRYRELVDELRPLISIERLQERMREASSSGDAARQRSVLYELARHPRKVSVPQLRAMLDESPDPSLRALALQLIFRKGGELPVAIAFDVVRDPSNTASLRGAALELLAARGHPKLEDLVRRLIDRDPPEGLWPSLRKAIIEARLDGFFGVLVEQLADAKRDELPGMLNGMLERAADQPVALQRALVRATPLEAVARLNDRSATLLLGLIGRFGRPEQAPELLKMLPRTLPKLQPALVEAVMRLGEIAPVDALLSLLGDQPAAVQRRALLALARLQRRGALWPALRAQLPKVKPDALTAAMVAVAAIAPADDGARQLLALMRRDSRNTKLRDLMIRCLAWLGPESFPHLRDGLSARSPRLIGASARSIRALAARLSAEDVAWLASAAMTAPRETRAAMLLMIPFSGHPSAAEQLERIAPRMPRSESATLLRVRALLPELTAEQLTEARAGLSSLDGNTLAAAMLTIGRHGAESDAEALLTIGDKLPGMRVVAARSLALLGSAKGADQVRAWLASDALKTQDKLAIEESLLALPGARQMALEWTEDIDKRARARALRALAALGPQMPAAARTRALALLANPEASVRAAAAEALVAAADPAAAKALIARLEREEHAGAREALLVALGRLGGDAARRWLAARLDSELGGDHGLDALLACALAGVDISADQRARAVRSAPDRNSRLPSAGLLALAGDDRARGWLWRDLAAIDDEYQARAHEALRLGGDRRYVRMVLARAHLEPFPRPTLRQLARQLAPAGAPGLRLSSRPAQDQDLRVLRAWWKQHEAKLRWDPERRVFAKPSE